jgi:hypothetical protein
MEIRNKKEPRRQAGVPVDAAGVVLFFLLFPFVVVVRWSIGSRERFIERRQRVMAITPRAAERRFRVMNEGLGTESWIEGRGVPSCMG